MWTPMDRGLVGDFRARQALTYDQFRLLAPLIPPARPGGRPRATDIRNLLGGLFYLVRTGCQWWHLPPPPAFPHWCTVYDYMRAFLRDGVWESIRHQFVVMLRESAGRGASPTAAIIEHPECEYHGERRSARLGCRQTAGRTQAARRLSRVAATGAPTGCIDRAGRNQIAVAAGGERARAARVEDATLGVALAASPSAARDG